MTFNETITDSLNCTGAFDYTATVIIIIISCVLGIGWAVFNFVQVRKIDVANPGDTSRDQLVDNVTDKQRKLIL